MNASAPSDDFAPTLPNDPTLAASENSSTATEAGAQMPAQAAPTRLPITFTGSGSEYFRIWIVNLLLILVTLGLYYPFAKVRRMRYFHSNTEVGGNALDFHADPWKMLRGYLLVAALFVVISVASEISPLAGLVSIGVLAAIWPLLLYSSMKFRLSNTSWRGLRFRFTGSVAGAYKAILPLFAPGLLMFGAALLGGDAEEPSTAWVGLFLLVFFAALALTPLLMWNLKKYQHDHYALGPWNTHFNASAGSFYGVFLKTFGVSILCAVAIGVLVTLASGAGMLDALRGAREPSLAVILVIVVLVMGMVVAQMIPLPYYLSRMQNLVWGTTGGSQLQFFSDLTFVPFLKLTLLNTLLTLVTLGLYRPWAAVATARMRLEAIAVEVRQDPAQLEDELRVANQDATGDAGGDFLGFDIGL
jgi:uncharacterized membrane protein YjgN (DUF898 family)